MADKLLGILSERSTRFNQLRRDRRAVAKSAVADLEERGADGLVRREAFAMVPVTVEYSITPIGKSLAEKMETLLH